MKFIFLILISTIVSVEASATTVCGTVHTIKMEDRGLFSIVMRKTDGTDQGIGIDVRGPGIKNAWMTKANLPVDLALLDLAKVAIASPNVELCLDTSASQKSFIRRFQ